MPRYAKTLVLAALLAACGRASDDPGDRVRPAMPPGSTGQPTSIERAKSRMLDEHLRARGIANERVLAAMMHVPREEFVPGAIRDQAYDDTPLPIGMGQTISQPYIVALMTALADPDSGDRALEIGTGSGYQAAVLAEIVDTVYTVEIIPELTEEAATTLDRLGYGNVVTATRDGYRGWLEHAPFDVILVTAAPGHVPQPLVDQLARGGKLVIPVGDLFQRLKVIERRADGRIVETEVADVRFVPMTGEAEKDGDPR